MPPVNKSIPKTSRKAAESRSKTFQLPRFYPIVDTMAAAAKGCDPVTVAEALIEAGVRILQYRHKEEWTQREYNQAAQIASLCRQAEVQFILNDRADFAQLLGAGVHLGQDDVPPLVARKVVPEAVMGFSTHNRRQLTMADEEPVDYLAIGPIFATVSKRNADPALGTEMLGKLRASTTKPLVAIGGITLENVSTVLAAGADSVAVLSGILPDTCDRSAISQRAAEWLALCLQPQA